MPIRRTDAIRPLAAGTTSTALRRSDGIGGRWQNALTGQGGVLDRHSQTDFVPSIPLPTTSVDAVMRFDAIGRRMISREPEDATREGYELEGVDPGLARDLVTFAEGAPEEGIEGLELSSSVGMAKQWANGYGGGAVLVIADDGQAFDMPLQRQGLRVVHSLITADRTELSVRSWGTDPRSRQTFGKPETYYWTSAATGKSLVMHASRVVPFHGVRLPPRIEQQNNGWGGSLFDLTWAYLRAYGTSIEYAAEAITLLTQGVMTTPNLAAAVNAGDAEIAAQRLEAMRMTMGMLGDIAIDPSEKYEVLSRPLSGIGEGGELIERALVAASGMPRVILFGETPGGINSGEQAAEVLAWYDHVAMLQRRVYASAIMRILSLIAASREGPTGGLVPVGAKIKFRPLWQLSEEERESMHLTRAQRRSLDLQSQVVTPDEARREAALVELYDLQPGATAPVNPAEDPTALAGPDDADDEAELGAVPQAPMSQIPKGEALLGAAAIASRLGCSASTVHAMAARGSFPAWRVGNRWRYAWSLVEASTSKGIRGVA